MKFAEFLGSSSSGQRCHRYKQKKPLNFFYSGTLDNTLG